MRKKKPQVDERLQHLPEKKSSPVSQQKSHPDTAIETGNETILLQALTLIDEVFYSKSTKGVRQVNDNVVYKSLNYLFVDKYSR